MRIEEAVPATTVPPKQVLPDASPCVRWTLIVSSTLLFVSVSARLLLKYGVISPDKTPEGNEFPTGNFNPAYNGNSDGQNDADFIAEADTRTAAPSQDEIADKTSNDDDGKGSLNGKNTESRSDSTESPAEIFITSTSNPITALTRSPTKLPSKSPTRTPTFSPTLHPTQSPTKKPTKSPTKSPTWAPTSVVLPERVTFYVLGDIPYDDSEKEELEQYMKAIPGDADFVVHIGDITVPSSTKCRQFVYNDVRKLLLESRAPVFITPGDNDINDCPNPVRARYHWLSNFVNLENKWKHRLQVVRQEERPENFAFYYKGTLFLCVNVVGDANIYPEETAQRHADNLRFSMEQLAKYGEQMYALVIFGHAKPRIGRYHSDYFVPLLQELESLGKPYLYAHGDFHFYDQAYFPNSTIGERLQVEMGKEAPPVQVTVRPFRRQRFKIDGGDVQKEFFREFGNGPRESKLEINFEEDTAVTQSETSTNRNSTQLSELDNGAQTGDNQTVGEQVDGTDWPSTQEGQLEDNEQEQTKQNATSNVEVETQVYNEARYTNEEKDNSEVETEPSQAPEEVPVDNAST